MHTNQHSNTILFDINRQNDKPVTRLAVHKDLRQFIIELSKWVLIAIPATFTNSAIRFCESKQGLAFRSILVQKAYKMYFKNQTYYR